MFRGRREREREREKNEPMIMGKVVNLSVAVPIRSGEKVTQKEKKKTLKPIRSVGIFFFFYSE